MWSEGEPNYASETCVDIRRYSAGSDKKSKKKNSLLINLRKSNKKHMILRFLP